MNKEKIGSSEIIELVREDVRKINVYYRSKEYKRTNLPYEKRIARGESP